MIIDGAAELGTLVQPVAENTLLLDEALGTLLRFSLVQRKRDEHTFSMHRLVQAILRTSMNSKKKRLYAENMVKAVNQAFPDVKDYRNWPRCQQYLPHAQVCVELIDTWEYTFPEAGRLLNQLGYYLQDRAQYSEAEPLYKRAIAIGEKTLGPEHPNLAIRLNNLAALYWNRGKYAEAEPLYQRVIGIDEKVLGPEHPGLAIDLNNLALLYKTQGKYEEAEPLYERAIAIDEKALGPEHPQLANHLNNLAYLYRTQGKYEEAEPLYKRALAIYENKFGPTHPSTRTIRENYDILLEDMNKQKG
jgi:tetratricopeptide (TPR) repeat protein